MEWTVGLAFLLSYIINRYVGASEAYKAEKNVCPSVLCLDDNIGKLGEHNVIQTVEASKN